MSDQDLPPERNSQGYLAAKLARLERLLEDQAARLRVVEQQLGLAEEVAPPRPFGQGHTADAKPQTNGQREPLPTPSPRPSATEPAGAGEAAPTRFSVTEDETAQMPSAPVPPSVTASPGTHTDQAHEHDAPTPPPDWRATDFRPAQRQYAARAASGANAPVPAATPARTWGDLETLVAGKLFLWVGMIAGTLAVSFFLKLAFERQWIGPTGRVLLGGVVGCALLALAERLRLRGYQAYAHVLSGGGILILYLSVYAAFSFYHLIGQPPAFALMALVTATAVVLAARYDAYAIAVLGLIGGFMTPPLLSTHVDNEVGLFGYVALLDAGVLALAYFKRWRSLNYLAFAATWLTFAGWAARFYDEPKLWLTLFFLTLFFVMFAALAVVHNVLKERRARWFDVSLILTNATLYFGTSYLMLDMYRQHIKSTWHWQGPHALLLAGFFGLLYFIARHKHRADKLLTYTYVAGAVTFLTMAVSIMLDQQWVTIGWAVEALMLTWVGLKADEDAPRFAALPVFAVAVMHWFIVDVQAFGYDQFYRPDVIFYPLLNKRAVSCVVLVGVCAGIVWLYRRYAERVDEDDRDILTNLFLVFGNVLAVTLLTLDLNDYFRQAIGQAQTAGNSIDTLANMQQFTLTVLWTLYCALALAVGLVRRLKVLRVAALFGLMAPVVKLLMVDALYYSAPWHTTIFNPTFLTFALCVAVLAFCVGAYARAPHVAPDERGIAVAALLATANVLALVGLSLEAMGHFNRVKALTWALPDPWVEAAHVENNKQLSLTFIWTTYAAGAFVIGFRRNRVALRYGALALLAVAGLKVLCFDATYYNAAWHAPLFNQTAAAFALFIAALWLVAFLYARADATLTDEAAHVVPAVTILGNVFALVALSLEASGYFAIHGSASALAVGEIRNLRLAQQLSHSVLWALYGGVMLVVGLVRRNRLLRLMALLLLGITTFKVFLFDLASLDKLYRIISFIVLGAILLAVSFLYQQRQQRAARAEGS